MGANNKSLLPVDTLLTSAVNAYEVYIDEAEGYYDGQKVLFKANLANTGAATLSINGRAAKAIKKQNDQALVANDIELGQYVGVVFNSTDDVFEMFTVPATSLSWVPTASEVANVPAGNIAATDVQAALNELDTEKAQLTTLAAAGWAALVGNTPAGNIAATTVQAALNELDTEKAAITYVDASIKTVTTTITSAEILALFTTPKELVPAPAVGSYVVVDKIVASLVYVSAAYATNTTLVFSYTNGSGTKVTADVTDVLTATANIVKQVGWIEAATTLTTAAPVVASVATGNPTAGNSDIKVTVTYRVLAI